MFDSYNFNSRTLIIFTIIQMMLAVIVTMLLKKLSIVGNNLNLGFLISLSLYIVVFLIPVIIYLKLIDRVQVLPYLKLTSELKSGIIKGLLIGIFIFVVIFIKNKFQISRQFNFDQDAVIILGKLLVGPLEEIPFRGFYLQKFKEYMKFWKANILSSVLFAAIHIPNFINGVTTNFYPLMLIFIVGLWMGYIFKETKSLWCVSIVHSVYNLSIWIIL